VNQREYNDRRSRADIIAWADVLQAELRVLESVKVENERLNTEIMRLLGVIVEYVIESNDVGGVDANDLASRVEALGWELSDWEGKG